MENQQKPPQNPRKIQPIFGKEVGEYIDFEEIDTTKLPEKKHTGAASSPDIQNTPIKKIDSAVASGGAAADKIIIGLCWAVVGVVLVAAKILWWLNFKYRVYCHKKRQKRRQMEATQQDSETNIQVTTTTTTTTTTTIKY